MTLTIDGYEFNFKQAGNNVLLTVTNFKEEEKGHVRQLVSSLIDDIGKWEMATQTTRAFLYDVGITESKESADMNSKPYETYEGFSEMLLPEYVLGWGLRLTDEEFRRRKQSQLQSTEVEERVTNVLRWRALMNLLRDCKQALKDKKQGV